MVDAWVDSTTYRRHEHVGLGQQLLQLCDTVIGSLSVTLSGDMRVSPSVEETVTLVAQHRQVGRE